MSLSENRFPLFRDMRSMSETYLLCIRERGTVESDCATFWALSLMTYAWMK